MARKNTSELNAPIDAFANTKLIREAQSGNWDGVRELLQKGADAQQKNIFGINALYYALEAGEFELAVTLFDAGARLDTLNEISPEGRSYGLILAAKLRRIGRDIFFDGQKTLAECCRLGLYRQAENMVCSASTDELTEAIGELLRNGRYQPEENLALLIHLHEHGGEIDEKILNQYSSSIRPPRLRNPAKYTQTIRKLLQNELYQKNLDLIDRYVEPAFFKKVPPKIQRKAAEHGLLLAAEKFKPTEGKSFRDYAKWWIKSHILKEIRKKYVTIQN